MQQVCPLLEKSIVVQGVESQPELNGLVGVATDYVVEDDRYLCTLDGRDGLVTLRPECVRKAPKVGRVVGCTLSS